MTKLKLIIGSFVLVLFIVGFVSIGFFGVSTSPIHKELPERKQSSKSSEYQKLVELDFTCSGSCYCDGIEVTRRISSVSVSYATLIFSISAFSVVTAHIIANNRFKSECNNLFSEKCEGSVDHAVEFCEESEERPVSSEVSKIPEKYKDYEAEYECFGHCVKNGKLLAQRSRPEARLVVENYDCEKLTTKGIVRVKIPQTGGKYFRRWNIELQKKEYDSQVGTPDLYNVALNRFRSDHLSSYCSMNSRKSYSYVWESPSTGREKTIGKTVNMCVAQNYMRNGVINSNQFGNISCEKKGESR